MNLFIKPALAAGLFLFSSLAWADNPKWAEQQFPFQQKMNMDVIYDVTHTDPENLVAKIQSYGVQILRVKTPHPQQALNPLLKAVPEASEDLLKKAEFQDSYEGRLIHAHNSCCDVQQDTILIRDTALSYTLIHEFMHAQLQSATGDYNHDEPEKKFAADFRKLNFYQRRLYDDPYSLLNPLWRRDILAAQQDVASGLFSLMQAGQSQEAIIEKVLSRYIDEKSPYYVAERRKNGLSYGEQRINNAIDIFNNVHASQSFTAETVANLLVEIKSGNIPKDKATLTEDEAKKFATASEKLAQELEHIKTQILEMKAFFVK
jgi:hypothetical protein